MSKSFILRIFLKKQKKIVFLLSLLMFSLFLLFIPNGYSQTNWRSNLEPSKAFIENQGQFQIHGTNEKVLFAFDGGPTMIYFTKNGISYNFLKSWKKEETEEEREKERSYERFASVEEWKEKEAEEHPMEFERDAISMMWENSNPSVEIIASEPTPDYHSYCIKENDGTIRNINNIKAFKKILYKNLYPGIDVEYVFHPTDGFKYSLIINPGADISKVIMKYSRAPQMEISGDIIIKTKFGNIVDHAPASFYADNKSASIASQFVLNENIVSFNLSSYNNTKPVIIDPWTQTPSLPNSNGVWECEMDGAGNVYIIGGCMPMKLLKYNATGVLQWTYNTPWDTANNWLGTFATDLAGNSFVTSGSVAALQKISTTGAMVWNYNAPLLSSNEYWNIAFNCDQTKLIIGGTTGNLSSLEGAIFDINTSNGSINSIKVVGFGNMFGFPPVIEEVRSITSCRNSRYYFLTLDTIGAIDDDFSVCPTSGPAVFRVNHTYGLSYKCENYRPNNGNSGIMAIRANRYFVYTQNGITIDKRSLIDGSIINSAAIPGGINVSTLGQHQVGNSGIDIDSCGNVYVGSGNGIYKFDANLNLITSIATTYKVSDVAVSTGGNVIFCGTTGTNNNTNRIGTIQSANMSACPYMTLYCCNSNLCPAGPFCLVDGAVSLTVETPGGIWSGPGVNPTTGVFDPGTAGVGTHTITYTIPCGSSSINIVVNSCAVLNVCQNLNGDLTVTGGTGPYSWQTSHDSVNCSACLIGCTFPPGCAVTSTLWTTFATGNTITPPASDTIRVIDNYGVTYIIYDTATIEACAGCPPFTFDITNIVNVCPGQSNGSFKVTTTGGTNPYDYILKNPAGTILASFNNVNGSQSFTGLAAGTYILVANDSDTCSDSTLVTITQPSVMAIALNPENEGCQNSCDGSITTMVSGGDGPYTYAWNNGMTTADITGLCNGNYSLTVTDSNSCTNTNSTIVVTSVIISAGFTANPQSGNIPLSVTFTYTGTGATSWYWDFGDGSNSTETNPVHIYDSIGTYNVILIVSTGSPEFCSDTSLLIITVQKPSSLIVPNVFTPNNDGHNDEFIIQYKEIESFTCTVFNRWGKKIFEWSDISKGWDGKTNNGKLAADGVYYYIITAKGLDMVEYNLNGTITMIK